MALSDLTVGSPLNFKLTPSLSGDGDPNFFSVHAKILSTFGDFTLSPVVKVAIDVSLPLTHSLPSEAVLKLYDRRCMTNTRADFDEGAPFSLHKELEYKQYLRALSQGDEKPCNFDDPAFVYEVEMSDGQFEAYLDYYCQKWFTAEVAAYQKLRKLQGSRIPRLYGTVQYQPPPLINDENGSEVALDLVNGLLLEYISSVPLRSFVEIWHTGDTPSSSIISSVCEDAVELINQISDLDVLNADVRLDNILVRLPTPPGCIANHGARTRTRTHGGQQSGHRTRKEQSVLW